MGRSHEGGYGLDLGSRVFRILIKKDGVVVSRVNANGQATGQDKQVATFRQGDDIGQFRLVKPVTAATGHVESGKITNLALAVSINQAGNLPGMNCLHYCTFNRLHPFRSDLVENRVNGFIDVDIVAENIFYFGMIDQVFSNELGKVEA